MKNFFLYITIFILSFFTFLKVNALVEPTSDFYVNDYANILSPETEKFIMDNSVKLQEETKAQIVVVTVKNLEGQDLNTYATDLYRSFGIGNEKEDNGLLILIALEEREIKIEVGYGLEGVITDGLVGRYLDDYFQPYFKKDKWDDGVKKGYIAFYQKICDYYHLDSSIIDENNQDTSSITETSEYKDAENKSLALGLFLGMVFGLFIRKDGKMVKKALIVLCCFGIAANIYIFYLYSKLFTGWDLFREFFGALCIEFVLSLAGIIFTTFVIYPRLHGESIGNSSHHGGGGSSGGGGASRHF